MTSAEADIVVIGSGAGGAITAMLLAEAGRSVTILEEGPLIKPGTVDPFSLEQMRLQYRNAGMTVALGRPPIAYAEGRCVGGGTEINSGLYHRLPGQIAAAWARRWNVAGLGPAELATTAMRVEEVLGVSPLPGSPSKASQALANGADELGWSAAAAPRAYTYSGGTPRKQSMMRTCLPRAQAAGATLVHGARVERIEIKRRRATRILASRGADHEEQPLEIAANTVFVCAGAIGTPALLQRSGFHRRIGGSLRVHPTAKLTARFDEELGGAGEVPVHQVEEFGPDLHFGGSISKPGYVAMALAGDWQANHVDMGDVQRLAVYYAAIRSQGRGRVIAIPGVSDPLVSYWLTRDDLKWLEKGLARLAHLLLAAGARTLYPSIWGHPAIHDARGVAALHGSLSRGRASLMTVHLCSTVPMGEDKARCPVDSWGRLRGVDNIIVNDASLLPEAPGVNPQGPIMAIAARNAERFLAD